MNEKKISELVLKLSTSSIPPSLQEYILSNLDKLQDENVVAIIVILDGLAECESDYLAKAEKFVEFYHKLSQDIKSELIREAEKIQQEVLQELIKDQK